MYKNQILKLSNVISFDSREGITDFLLKNPELIGIINDTIKQIRMYFPEEKLKLKVDVDQEICSDSGVLVLLVVTKKEPDEVIELLDKLNERLWFKIKLKTDQQLLIQEEYE